jgi:cysteine synthase
MTKDKILKLIGNTPIIRLNGKNIFAKLDSLNPSGSIKDVMASYMIEQAENKGLLKKGTKIIEATTGNTGISFAMLSALKGYKFVAVMPENMSKERIQMMESFNAKIILTPAEQNMQGAIDKYNELVEQNKDAWLPKQFENEDNINAHYNITGKEIINQVGGDIDFFVAGVGTGGTLIGVAKALKEINPDIKIVAVEPAESAVLSGKKPKLHEIQGIGEGFVPKLLKDNIKLMDEVIQIKSKDAIEMAKKLAKKEGVLVGISSGANALACFQIAEKNPKKKIVTIFPDRGERYLSMGIYN